MFIKKIEDNLRKMFVLVLRSSDGVEYEVNISANNENEAEWRLKNLLEMSYSLDEFVGLKQPKKEE
jgi:hypothetical protein